MDIYTNYSLNQNENNQNRKKYIYTFILIGPNRLPLLNHLNYLERLAIFG